MVRVMQRVNDLISGRHDERFLGTEHPFGILGDFEFNTGHWCLMPTPETMEELDEEIGPEFAAVEIRIFVAKRGRQRKEMYDSEG